MKKVLLILCLAVAGFNSCFAQSYFQLINAVSDTAYDSLNFYIYANDSLVYSFNLVSPATILVDSPVTNNATPISRIAPGIQYRIWIAPGWGTVADTFPGSFAVGPFLNDSTYEIIAAGLITPGYKPNPEGISTAFNIFTFKNAEQAPTVGGTTGVLFFNASTDAPRLYLSAVNDSMPYIPPFVYGTFDSLGYINFNATYRYFMKVADSSGNILRYSESPFYKATSTAIVVYSEGFVNPVGNHNGGWFNMCATLYDGSTLLLPPQLPAYIQVIHDSPDTSIKSMEVFLAETEGKGNILSEQVITFDSLPSTAYLPVFSVDSLLVGFAPPGSTSFQSTYQSFSIGMLNPYTYTVFVASGVLDTTQYPSNPSGASTLFNIYRHDGEVLDPVAHSADLLFFNGVQDAPSANLSATSPDSINVASNLDYGSFAGYQNFDSATYLVQLNDSGNASTVQTFSLSFALPYLIDSGAVIYSGGFADGAMQIPVQYHITFANGTTLPLQLETTGINGVQTVDQLQLFPNPSSRNARLSFNLEKPADVSYNLVNSLGQQVQTATIGIASAGYNFVDIDVSGLNAGIYILDLVLDRQTHITRMMIVGR